MHMDWSDDFVLSRYAPQLDTLGLRDRKVRTEDIRRALEYLRGWLSKEWEYFNLARHLTKADGVTIHPLNVVKKPDVKSADGVKVRPEKNFECEIDGAPVARGYIIAIIFHEFMHMHQPLIGEYIFNESILLLVAEALSSPKEVELKKKYVKSLTRLRVRGSQLKFLEVRPCIALLNTIEANSRHGLYDKTTANRLTSRLRDRNKK